MTAPRVEPGDPARPRSGQSGPAAPSLLQGTGETILPRSNGRGSHLRSPGTLGPDESTLEHTWSARKVRPIVVLYVIGVFLAFVLLAHFVFHSGDAVRALLVAAVGSVASLVPGILTRTEYRLTRTGLARSAVRKGQPREFEHVFSWDEITRLVPTTSGFRYYLGVQSTGRLARFVRLRLLRGRSGEVRVEKEDRERVEAILARRGIVSAERPGGGRVGPTSSV